MKRLMPKPERIFGNRAIKVGPRRALPLTHQCFVAAESSQPIAGRCFGGRNPQVRQQISDSAASNERQPRRYRRSFHEVLVTINETGRKHMPTQPDHVSTWANVRFDFVVAAVRKNPTVTNCDGVAFRVTPDSTMMYHQISLFGSHPHPLFSGCYKSRCTPLTFCHLESQNGAKKQAQTFYLRAEARRCIVETVVIERTEHDSQESLFGFFYPISPL
jgi:hypothetical protein